MPPRTESDIPLMLIHGEDEFAVKDRARQQFQTWCQASEGADQEIIDGQVSNSAEAMRSLARLREALQTLPFFGGAKVIWWRGCNFFGDDRTASTQAVGESLAELAQELKTFSWKGVQLLISAGKVDKRKTFYKTIEKHWTVEAHAAWGPDSRHWQSEAESLALQTLRARSCSISDEALGRLVDQVGPNRPQLAQELEKLMLYVGDHGQIQARDVDAVVTRQKQAQAFALGDALGDRDLPRLLKTLDGDLWEMRVDRQKSEIGTLYGLISKVRMLILAKELLREKWIQPSRDYARFKSQLQALPAEQMPSDARFNPQAISAYPLFRAVQQAANYSSDELVEAMQLLLECNRRLISSGLDGGLILQQTLVQIASRAPAAARPNPQFPG